ncbi:MAG: plastocyanin/azurin family copper-binding protein, partial [Gemmatimonadota bacterium]|nr:plastocyanin/azurin family copper-binding protein [Gemmatimonadota bacterium]
IGLGAWTCGGGGAVGPEQPQAVFSSLLLSPDSIGVTVGGAVQLTITPRDQNDATMTGLPAPTLTVEDPAIASISGTVVSGLAAGSTRIFATITAGAETHADTSRVVVTDAPAGGPAHPVTTVGTTFAPSSITIAVGDSVSWVISGATHNVTFNTASKPAGGDIPDTPPGTTVSRIFTGAGVYGYECTIHSGMTAQVVVQSGQTQVFTSVGLTPASASLLTGDTLSLTAVAQDQNGVPMAGLPAPNFISSNAAVAVVSPTGRVTAVSPGVDTVTASITSGGTTHAATAVITVSAPAAGATVTTPNLTFSPPTVTIQAGQTVTWQFSGATHNVTWLPGPVPTGGDIPDQTVGSTVQRSFPTAGVYTYECTRHNNMTGSVVVQSGQAQVFTSVSVTPATATLQTGGTVQLTATPLDQSGVPMTGLPAATFVSGNAAVATVSPQGLVTAVSAGTTNVTATITSGGVTQSATATIIVSAPVPGSVTVTTPNLTFSPSSVTIATGGTVTWQFSGNTHNVTFTGAAPAGGNIPDQPAGSSQSRTFTASGNFAYVCTRHNGMTGTVVVSGGGGTPVYTSLQLTPQSPLVPVGASVQLTATPLDQNGAPMTGLPAATFASADATIATVSLTGLVTGVSIGSTTVTATLTSGGFTHSAPSVVTVGTPASATITTPNLTFAPDDIGIAPGQTVLWTFSGTTHNVTFETLAPPGGNIPDTAPGTSVARSFPQVGDYKYFCSIHSNMKGRVRVK